MLEETLVEQPDFFSSEGYTFYYLKQKLRDFNGEVYDINNMLSGSLIENNPELYGVLEYFVTLTSMLDCDDDIKDKCLDTLYNFMAQIDAVSDKEDA